MSRDSGSTVTGRSTAFPSGNGVSFVRVLLQSNPPHRLQVTDKNGSFTMLDVPMGTHTISFARFGVTLYTTELVIDQPNTTYIVNLPILEAGTNDLSGVVQDFTNDIGYADVWVILPGGELAYAMCDEHGQYMIPDLPDGDIMVIASARGYETNILEDLWLGFEGVSVLDIELEPIPPYEGATVRGFVRDQDGEILEDAYVGIFQNDIIPELHMIAQAETLSTLTGYELEDIPEGTYTLICTHSGFNLSTELVIVEPGTVSTIDFTLESE